MPVKFISIALSAVALALLAGFLLLRIQVSRSSPPGLELSSLLIRFEPEEGPLQAIFVPKGEFFVGRSVIQFDQVRAVGRMWPPLSNCVAEIRGLTLAAQTYRPSSAMAALTDLDHLVGMTCPEIRLSGGEIQLGDSPVIRFEFEEAMLRSERKTVEVRVGRIDGQPTRLVLEGLRADRVHTRGEWNLSGFDVTALLARLGMSWDARTDVGFLVFESEGSGLQEIGHLQLASWVLVGNNPRRPFRLSVPNIEAEFSAGDTEISFNRIRIDRPNYDLIGASPAFFRRVTARPSFRPSRLNPAKLDVSEKHQSRLSGRKDLPPAFSVRVEHLRVDSGAALALDRPEHTRSALKLSDIDVRIDGMSPIVSRSPNTFIRFLANDQREIRWKAVTDFSTWPPQFRLTDVK